MAKFQHPTFADVTLECDESKAAAHVRAGWIRTDDPEPEPEPVERPKRRRK